MKRRNKSILSLIILIFLASTMFSCSSRREQLDYYSNEGNYIEVTGTINHVVFDEENQILYLGFSDLSEPLDDDSFKIVGDNYSVISNDFKEYIRVGEIVTFVTAPKYFGDGYVMPIVSLSINDTCLIEYEDGLTNFLTYLKNNL